MYTKIVPSTSSTNFREIKDLVMSENNYKGIDKKYVWYAYKGGVSHGPYNTLQNADAISKITEKVCTNEHEYKANNEWYYELIAIAHNIRHENILDELGVSCTDHNKQVVSNILNVLGENGEETIDELYGLFNKLIK